MKAMPQPARLSWRQVVVLLATAASFGLLNWQLASRSLWNDEAASRIISTGSLGRVILAAAADIHPPLYFLLLHAWTGVAGTGDFSLRWLSVASAILAIPLIAVTGRRLFGGATGAIAAVGLAFAPAFIEFARMARYYSLLVTLGLLSTLLLLIALRRPGWRWWAAYALSGTALLYTFYPAAGLLLAHAGLVFFWSDPQRRLLRSWLFAAVAMGVAFLPMLVTAAAQRVASVAAAPGADLSRSAVGFVLGLASSGYTFSVGETIFPWNPAAWVGLAAVATLLIVALRSGGRYFWLSALCASLSLVFMSITTTFVSVSTPFLNVPVRGLFALAFFILCLAAGLSRLPGRWIKLALGGALLAVWAISLANDYRGSQFLNPIYLTPAKEAAARVNSQAAPNDLVISDFDSLVNDYLPPTLPNGQPGPARVTTQDNAAIDSALTAQPARVWLVTLGRDASERTSNADSVRQRLSSEYVLDHAEGMLPIDPTYRRVKDLVLRRASYQYRLTIELYNRRAP